MKRKKRAEQVQKLLDRYIPHPKTPLHHKNVYTFLIAVLLSARCTDAMVNRVTPTLFAKATTPEHMLKLSIAEIQKIIRPCGLSPRKAVAIYSLSKILIDKHQGEVPMTFQELEALPGVGHKTASVVMSQAFKLPAFPVDTHIYRCARRWGLSRGKTVRQVERDLKEIFPENLWRRLHLQIIFYARQYCPARGHKQEKCPICKSLEILFGG